MSAPNALLGYWESLLNSDEQRSSLTMREDHLLEIALSRSALRLPSEPLWDSGPMLPYYFDVPRMAEGLKALADGDSTGRIPILFYLGVGDNASARGEVQGEAIEIVRLPSREFEIRWLWRERIKSRYRRSDRRRTLAAQMPYGYWDQWQLLEANILGESWSRYGRIRVIQCRAHEPLQDEHGVGPMVTFHYDPCLRVLVVGQLDDGSVLWWHFLGDGQVKPARVSYEENSVLVWLGHETCYLDSETGIVRSPAQGQER